MKILYFSMIAGCCWGLTCTPTVQLEVETPYGGWPGRDASISMNDEGDGALLWIDYVEREEFNDDEDEDQYHSVMYQVVAIATSEAGKWSSPQLVTDILERTLEAPRCRIDAKGNVAVAWKTEDFIMGNSKNAGSFWGKPHVVAVEDLRSLPFILDHQGNALFLSANDYPLFGDDHYLRLEFVEKSIFSSCEKRDLIGQTDTYALSLDTALVLGESGTKFLFLEGASKGSFYEMIKPKNGPWSPLKSIDAEWLGWVDDIRVAIDSKDQICVVGVHSAPSEKKGEDEGVWARIRSSDGEWSKPQFISNFHEEIDELQIAVNQNGDFLALWEVEGSFYSASKPKDQDWRTPLEIIHSNTKYEYLHEKNSKPIVQAAPNGDFVLLWQGTVAVEFSGLLHGGVMGSVYSNELKNWSSSCMLSPENQICILTDFAMNGKGVGLAAWEVVPRFSDDHEGYIQVATVRIDDSSTICEGGDRESLSTHCRED